MNVVHLINVIGAICSSFIMQVPLNASVRTVYCFKC